LGIRVAGAVWFPLIGFVDRRMYYTRDRIMVTDLRFIDGRSPLDGWSTLRVWDGFATFGIGSSGLGLLLSLSSVL
jgi:hypothetical protein